MAESAGEKSFEPTAHRRQQAREQGQVAFSQDLGSAVLLVLGGILLLIFGGSLVDFFAGFLRRELSEVGDFAPDSASVMTHWHLIMKGLTTALLPMLGLLVLAGVLSNVLQIGFLFVPDRIVPDFSRISPAAGLGRIFSLTGVTRLTFGLFKVAVITGVAAIVLWSQRDEIFRACDFDVMQLGSFLVDISLRTLLWTGLALVVLALFDYAVQRWKHEQDLMMTHQEVREEMKDLQGDPQIIARRRAVQRQMVMHRISSSVPKADVVVTNPTELAVAIQYEPTEMAAPVVVAKGAGVLAQRIRRLALENNIPIVERKPLAQLLYKEVDLNHPVPTESYAAVAEVLAYVYQLKGKKVPMPPKVA
jgi:flagellar biosynthetic protein FlhB